MSGGRQPSACFFAKVPHPGQLDTVEFYAQDIRFLEDLGYRVRRASRLSDLFHEPVDDLYFCWWWTWAWLPVAIAQSFMRPAIVTGTFNHHLYRARPYHHRTLIAWAAKHATANVFVSELEREAAVRLLPGTSRPSVSPHTVDTDTYAPPILGWAARDPHLLVTVAHLDGGNSVRKCVAESIRAVGILRQQRPSVRCIIAGECGSDYPALARLVVSLGLTETVTFVGSITRDEKIELMQRCGVYLQPSTFEGFGLAGLEAMACGAPVVTSRVGGVPEVGGDAVVYVDGTDPAAIAGAVAALWNDGPRRAALGTAGRQRALAHFSPSRRRTDLAAVLRAVGAPC